jgi:hypothetical protein
VDRIHPNLRSATTQKAVARKWQAQPFGTPEALEILPPSFEKAVLGVTLTANGGNKPHSFDFRKRFEFCDRNPPDHSLLPAIVDEHQPCRL